MASSDALTAWMAFARVTQLRRSPVNLQESFFGAAAGPCV
jgi:hypothetical protein